MSRSRSPTLQINVTLSHEARSIELADGSNTFSLLRELSLVPDAVLVFRNGSVLPEDEPLTHGDGIEIVSIASGG